MNENTYRNKKIFDFLMICILIQKCENMIYIHHKRHFNIKKVIFALLKLFMYYKDDEDVLINEFGVYCCFCFTKKNIFIILQGIVIVISF